MGAGTGIAWTDATANFIIGCQTAGTGCDRCYAAALAKHKFGIVFGPDGERRETKSGFSEPLKWQRMHDNGQTHFKGNRYKHGADLVPVPVWCFACSLSDFFDNKWPTGVRERAWRVIRCTPSLRWQIVTKRVGNVPEMLPDDWEDGHNYSHVGIIATVCDQREMDRDGPKLEALYDRGVKWTGLSIEPQLERVAVHINTDWVITGGESTQDGDVGRPYNIAWARELIRAGERSGTPVFVKQLGAQPVDGDTGVVLAFGPRGKHDDPERWPRDIVVQQMPRIYEP